MGLAGHVQVGTLKHVWHELEWKALATLALSDAAVAPHFAIELRMHRRDKSVLLKKYRRMQSSARWLTPLAKYPIGEIPHWVRFDRSCLGPHEDLIKSLARVRSYINVTFAFALLD